ncbi:hypothetical protein [uncultured Tenacibaculum sp.]|uniref:hypothetical protein n=1 Tax=uncultured Tenacibaculum sp. TaxID=174713 RepID=UPI002613F8D6|nr:hypothetical protein [uncultured Tenacibaculum sp.]
MINIFIGLSNNQIKSYEALIPKIQGEKILLTSNTLSINEDLFSQVIYTSVTFNNQASSKIQSIKNITSKIKSYKRILKQVEKYKKEKNIKLYFTYIEDILTNYMLFFFNKNIKGIVVEDGTLNYYYHSIKSLNKTKVYLKKILCLVYGLNFKLYKGHSSGIEYTHVEKQYVRSPHLSLFPQKSELLLYSKRTASLTNTFLIIGQEAYINENGKDLYLKRLNELISIIKSQEAYSNTNTIYYKPHRHGARIDYKLLDDAFKQKTIKILDANKPLEDLYFNTLASKYIFSFDSSALLNIYLEATEEIQKHIKFIVLLKYNKQLKSIFKKFNFEVIE